MISIQFPAPDFKIRLQDGFDEIFDTIRKQWVKLTPEEWVRQNFVAYLVKTVAIPVSMISIEREIRVGELKRRFDIVVYDNKATPWLLVECKAISVQLSEKTISQTLAYISQLKCKYMFITNGSFTYGWKLETNSIESVSTVPSFTKSI